MPTRGSKKAAGYDLYTACEKESTDLVIELPDGYFAAIYARSGLATKESLRPANCIRVVDSDYRGAYIVAVPRRAYRANGGYAVPSCIFRGNRRPF